MTEPLAIVIMGSKNDMQHCEPIIDTLHQFNVNVKVHISSAHKTPEHLLQILTTYEALDIPKVYITVAGRSNALSGFVDGVVNAPVIACPPLGSNFAAVDVFSSLRMPSGICPAVILEPKNAALMAVKILSLNNKDLGQQLINYKKQQKDIIIDADKKTTK